MTPKHREVMQQALEFLTNDRWGTRPYMDICVFEDAQRLVVALQEALAEPGQEPKPVEETLWPVWDTGPTNKDYEDAMRMQRLNQIISPHRKWVGLTYGEVDACFESAMFNSDVTPTKVLFYEAIEAKLKEKNT